MSGAFILTGRRIAGHYAAAPHWLNATQRSTAEVIEIGQTAVLAMRVEWKDPAPIVNRHRAGVELRKAGLW